MVIAIGYCTKEKWKIAHLGGLPKIEFTNQERSISITFFRFSIGHNGYTYGWV